MVLHCKRSFCVHNGAQNGSVNLLLWPDSSELEYGITSGFLPGEFGKRFYLMFALPRDATAHKDVQFWGQLPLTGLIIGGGINTIE